MLVYILYGPSLLKSPLNQDPYSMHSQVTGTRCILQKNKETGRGSVACSRLPRNTELEPGTHTCALQASLTATGAPHLHVETFHIAIFVN